MNIRDINYSSGATKTMIEDAKCLSLFRPTIERPEYGYSISLTQFTGSLDFIIHLHNESRQSYRQLLREQIAKKCKGRKAHFVGTAFTNEAPVEMLKNGR